MPPSLALDADTADRFFDALRQRFAGQVVCEPRHASWFGEDGGALLARHGVARVAADPAPVAGAGEPVAAGPEGARPIVYYRLHGSPVIYHSAYEDDFLDRLAPALERHAQRGEETWCIFDNTASGAATPNAFTLLDRLA